MAVSSYPLQAFYIRRAKASKRKDAQNQDNESATKAQSSSDVDENKRHFVMDMVPEEAGGLEVGTVASIAEEVKKFLTEFFRSNGHEGFQFPGELAIDIHLKHNENMDCPFLNSGFRATSNGCASYTEIEIYALSGNVEDIFQVLLQMEISSFNLYLVQEKYVAGVKDFLSSNPFMRKLCICEHYLEKHQEWVHDAVKSSESLSTLEFKTNLEMNEGLKDYLRHIYESKSLKKVDLARVQNLSQDQIDSLAEGLLAKKPSKLKTLDISVRYSSTWYTDLKIDISNLARVLRDTDTLEEFNVAGRTLAGSESILECAKLLECNKCLKKLDLQADAFDVGEDCPIDPDVWISMGKALPRSCALQYLDISSHQVSEASWKALGLGLRENTSLLTLKASKPYRQREEKLTDILLPVFEGLGGNRTLQALHLIGYDLSDSFASLEALESVLVESSSLKSVKLENSSMTDAGIAMLSRSLPKMKNIEDLGLKYQKFGLEGARALARGIKNNYSVLSVEVGTELNKGYVPGIEHPMGAQGFEKEYHEIQYYARMNRKGRRCVGGSTPIKSSLWPWVLANKALKNKEESLGQFVEGDIREKDYFAGNHDTSIDAVFFLLRDVVVLPVGTK